jgi:oligopeptide transport system substrate-binding protein
MLKATIHCLGVCVLIFTLGGCSGGGQTKGSVLRVGNGAEVQGLDPHMVTGLVEHHVLTSLYEGLADLDLATMTPIPGAAASWTLSEDKRTYTFHLRPDGRWSNGDAVTATDFAYAWQRMLSPRMASEYAYLLHCIENAKAYNEAKLTDFGQVGVKVLDTYTLQVILTNPTPYFLPMQIHYAWFPVHKATIEAHGAMDERGTRWTRAGNLVGNGAFTLVEWSPNEILRVEKNDHYWDAAKVRLAGIEFYPIDNQQTEERSFRSGKLHLTSTIPMDSIKRYREDNPEVLHIHPALGSYFYRLNTTKAPFTDKRVRQAFSYALDREKIASHVMKGGETPAYFFTPPDIAGYTSTAKVPFDPQKARELLAEAGYPNGEGFPAVELLFNTSETHKRIAEAIQDIWKEHLNVKVLLLNQDWKVYLSSMSNLDYTVARSSWYADVADPINFLECFLSGGGNNRTGFKSPAFDALIQKAYAEPDAEVRLRLLQEAEAILLDEAPIVPIYFYTEKYLQAESMKGLVENTLSYRRWRDFYLEDEGP